MHKRSVYLVLIMLVSLLASCSAGQTAIPTQQADPLAPTTAPQNPTYPTLTPEIFIPLNPSPTPANSSIPPTCQVTDLSVFIDQANGICYAYPPQFMLGEVPMLSVEGVQGIPVDSGADRVAATFAVQVSPYDVNQPLLAQVDDFLKGFSVAAPSSLTHTDLTVAGEPAIRVDMVPVQLSWRIVFVSYGNQLYRLMYWPQDVPALQSDFEQLYQTTINSFAFLPSEPINTSAETPTGQPVVYEGVDVACSPATLVIPPGLASRADCIKQPLVDGADAPWFDKAPAHTQLTLNDYLLSGKSIQPQVVVYPAQDYAALNTIAAQNLTYLRSVQENPAASANAGLPVVPFFNSIPVYSAVPQVIPFQNGTGVRFLTQYAQYSAPANNQELFYTFQGLTADGAYYIVATFPITAPGLGESSDPNAAVPVGGVAYPKIGSPEAEWTSYYAAVTDLLTATAPKAFIPTLAQLDTLIESMRVAP